MTNRQLAMGRPIFIVDDEPEILLAVDTTLKMTGMDNIITLSKDLGYRISTHTLTLPTLRERFPDLPLLLDRFICNVANELDKPVTDIPKTLINK